MRLAAVILAAGASKRMGTPKMLLPWGATSILGSVHAGWQVIGADQVAIVHAGKDTAVVAELDRCGVAETNRIANPVPERGMWSSVIRASEWEGWNEGLTQGAIVLGDQPHLGLETLRKLVQFAAAQPEKISQPRYRGKMRHPVILPRKFFVEISSANVENLKQFLEMHEGSRAGCEIDDAGLELDLDEPSDYEKGLKLGFPGPLGPHRSE